jgi:hypothetical protein
MEGEHHQESTHKGDDEGFEVVTGEKRQKQETSGLRGGRGRGGRGGFHNSAHDDGRPQEGGRGRGQAPNRKRESFD